MAESEENIPYILKDTHVVNGILRLKVTTPEILQKIKEYPVHEDDIYMCGYPKSGNTWTQTILRAILNQDDLSTVRNTKFEVAENHLDCCFPTASILQKPSVFWNHLDYKLLPDELTSQKGKLIYMVRNPKDVAVSFYYWHKMFASIGPWKGTWEVYFEHFLNGNVVFGDWFDHARSYLAHRNDNNMLIVKYEDLKMETKHWITKIADFIGKPLEPEKVEDIADMVEFTNMKRNPCLTIDGHPMLIPGSEFMRKGVIGDWRNYFTAEQNRRMDEKLEELRQETGCDIYAD